MMFYIKLVAKIQLSSDARKMKQKWKNTPYMDKKQASKREREMSILFFCSFLEEISQSRILLHKLFIPSFSLSFSTNHFSLVRFFPFQALKKNFLKRKYVNIFVNSSHVWVSVCVTPLLLLSHFYIAHFFCLFLIHTFQSIISWKN